jgi:hypothetical protein
MEARKKEKADQEARRRKVGVGMGYYTSGCSYLMRVLPFERRY